MVLLENQWKSKAKIHKQLFIKLKSYMSANGLFNPDMIIILLKIFKSYTKS